MRSVVRCRSSLSNRAFSMAMTACAAKFLTSSICLSVKGRTSWRIDGKNRSVVVLEHRDSQKRPRRPQIRLQRWHPDRCGQRSRQCCHIG